VKAWVWAWARVLATVLVRAWVMVLATVLVRAWVMGSASCILFSCRCCNASGERVEGLNRFIEALLNTAVLGLPLPATKRPPVVLQTEGDALTGQWAGAQTSSMMAISALSPRRGTVRMMRV
jgi:hypothetical protein